MTDEELIRNYRLTFGPPWGQAVMQDLMKHCHFRVPLPDDNIQIGEGMRRAFLRIVQMTALTPEQLKALYGGKTVELQEDDE